MDFFQHQDEARAKTRSLIRIFILAVVLLIIAIYIPVALVVGLNEFTNDSLGGMAELPDGVPFDPGALLRWYQPKVFLGVTVSVLAIVGLGSLMKTLALRGGGGVVAESLGGSPVVAASTAPQERVLLNVVEEMAIASGVPVPAVYILRGEAGINAFAAGWTMDDAAVAVTEGALEQLSRDELQGVVAHEFSHILNGDMRLNIRLMGLLHGILMISLIGRFMLRAVGEALHTTKNSKDSAAFVVIAVGLGIFLVTVGSIGWFLGQLVKAGVSRQREFLADASAVQFTRNPAGLAGALQRISEHFAGSRLKHSRAEEASHMLFGSPLKAGFWGQMLASHPPVEKRIERLGVVPLQTAESDPGSAAETGRAKPFGASQAGAAAGRPPPLGAALGFAGQSSQPRSLDADEVVARIGTLDSQHLAAGSALLQSVPESLRAEIESPLGAVGALYALLLDAESSARREQIEAVFGDARPAVFDSMMSTYETLQDLPHQLRLPLGDLATLPLRTLPEETLQAVVQTMTGLIESDGRVELFEFALYRVLRRRLSALSSGEHSLEPRHKDPLTLLPDLALLLSALARVGHSSQADEQRAFDHGTHCLSFGAPLQLVPKDQCSFSALGASLDRLARSVPGLRHEAVDAASHCVLADGAVTPREAELLRVIATDLGCPMPVFLDS